MTIAEDVYAVGVKDWNLRSFHGYSTPFGTTYNAYLILDQKNTLIDTVKGPFFDTLLHNIERILPCEKIDYIISNHAEMDHSGCLVEIARRAPGATIICSTRGRDALLSQFGQIPGNIKVVESGETLSIGKKTLQFFHTPMVHWPESMVTWMPEDGILFSNDAFGQHYASPETFADEVGCDIAIHEARKYYANIVNPYNRSVVRALELLSGLNMAMIAPSHGLIWRKKEDVARILSCYGRWSANRPGKTVLIAYNTMWGSTRIMAKECYNAIVDAGFRAEMFDLDVSDISDIAAAVVDSACLLLGASIMHAAVLPAMTTLVGYLGSLKFSGRFSWTFGSYGWAENSFRAFEEAVGKAGFPLAGQGFYTRYVPDRNAINSLLLTVNKFVINRLKESHFEP